MVYLVLKLLFYCICDLIFAKIFISMNISAKFDSFFFLLLFFFQLIHFFFIYFFSILIISRLGRFGLMLSRKGNFKYCKSKKKFTVFFFQMSPEYQGYFSKRHSPSISIKATVYTKMNIHYQASRFSQLSMVFA